MEYRIDDKRMEELENRFTYHAPKEGQADRYTLMRDHVKKLAIFICKNTPYSREQNEALTHLEDVMMWGNASIARNE